MRSHHHGGVQRPDRSSLRVKPMAMAKYGSACERPRCSLASLPGANYQPYALRSRGPRKYHRIKPSSGSSTTAIVQINFFSLETELWKILIIAQRSPANISTPKRPPYPKFIICGSFRLRLGDLDDTDPARKVARVLLMRELDGGLKGALEVLAHQRLGHRCT